MRSLTVHESIIRKALPYGVSLFGDRWSGSGDGYECESVYVTADEATVINAAVTLAVCETCARVIEDGDRKLTHRFHTFCVRHGHEYLRNHDYLQSDPPRPPA